MQSYSVLQRVVFAGVFLATTVASAAPDLTTIELTSVAKFGEVDGVAAYSIGTTVCNRGSVEVPWVSNISDHPVRTQNIYRVLDGQLDHLGQAWVVHGFCALDLFCDGCIPSMTCTSLGRGCATTNSSLSNGSQSAMGPKSEVNAATGQFPYPPNLPGSNASALNKRLQVKVSELGVSGARYFVTSQSVTRVDAEAGTNRNNQAWREVTVGGGNVLDVTGVTATESSPIDAWAALAAAGGVTVEQRAIDIPDDGRLIIAASVRDIGSGLWRYSYAVHNETSCLGANKLRVAVNAGAVVSDQQFRSVEYHSGELQRGTAWDFAVSGSVASWTMFAESDSNVLRWDTTYSYSMTVNVEPALGLVVIESTDGVGWGAMLPVPRGIEPGDFNRDGVVNSNDLFDFLSAFFAAHPDADLDGSGDVDSVDYFVFLSLFF